MSDHKAEAQKALLTVIEALAGPEPIVGIRRFQLKGSAEYALEQVGAIQELKRSRKPAAGDGGQ